MVCPSPLGELVAGLPGPNHQFEVERGQDQQETIHGEATWLQFKLGVPRLAGATGLHTQLLLTQIPLSSCPPEERSQREKSELASLMSKLMAPARIGPSFSTAVLQ